MNYILVIQFCSLITSVYSLEPIETPFIFNPFTLEIYDWPDSPDDIIKGPFVSACPAAENRGQQNLNENQSMDKKALFVRDYPYKENIKRSEIKMCEKSYQLSVAFDRVSKLKFVQFGYEIYYDRGRIFKYALKSSYKDFGPVDEAHSWFRKIGNTIKRPRSPNLEESSTYNSSEDMNFLWISKITVRLSPSLWSLIRVKYYIHRNTIRQLSVKCQDHDLGSRFYQEKYGPVDKFYTDQKNVFGLVKLPQESTCKSTLDCIKKYDLLPPYHFEPHPSSPISCSNLTTVPIWYEITEKLLNYSERFLIAMGQISEHKLIITAGTYDVLSFPIIGRESKQMSMYLNLKNKKIPIPKIIYKMVWYQSYKCNQRKSLCWFVMLIVIHNHPTVTTQDRLCLNDKCEDWGWENIQYMNVSRKGMKSEHIYCCELDEKLRKKLDYKLVAGWDADLKLKDFPHYNENSKDDDNDRNYYDDMQKAFEDQMVKFENEIQGISKPPESNLSPPVKQEQEDATKL